MTRELPALGFELVDPTPQEVTAARRRVIEILGVYRPPTEYEAEKYREAGLEPPG